MWTFFFKYYYWNTFFKWGGWVFRINIVFIEFPVLQGLLEYFAFVKWLLGLQSRFLMVTWITIMIFDGYLDCNHDDFCMTSRVRRLYVVNFWQWCRKSKKTNYELWAIQLLSAHVSSVTYHKLVWSSLWCFTMIDGCKIV